MISTPLGPKTVEFISVGDEVITTCPHSGSKTVSKVRWVGQQKVTANAGLPDDLSGFPVTVRADAIADGVPYQDLKITAEHCLFFGGKLSPVRVFVNGESIYYDKSNRNYTCYHLELDTHSLLSANGVSVESYLDTGNKFRLNHDRSLNSPSRSEKSWDVHAVAPLDTSVTLVSPIYDAISARAGLEPKPVRDASHVSSQTLEKVQVLTDSGYLIAPHRSNGDNLLFRLPPGVSGIRLLSDHGRPYDRLGPVIDDRRTLGLLVGRVTLFKSANTQDVTEHLHNRDLKGWYDKEPADLRWTDGDAYLPIDSDECDRASILAIEVKGAIAPAH